MINDIKELSAIS